MRFDIMHNLDDSGSGVRATMSFDFYAGSAEIAGEIEDAVLRIIGTANLIERVPSDWREPEPDGTDDDNVSAVLGRCKASRHAHIGLHFRSINCVNWRSTN